MTVPVDNVQQIAVRPVGPVRIRRLDGGDPRVAGSANRSGIDIRPWNHGRTVEGRRVVAHELAHVMDIRDLSERQRQHIGTAILGGKWDPEKFAEYAAWAAVMPKTGRVAADGKPWWQSKGKWVGGDTQYGVRLDAGRLEMLRKWLVNIPLYARTR